MHLLGSVPYIILLICIWCMNIKGSLTSINLPISSNIRGCPKILKIMLVDAYNASKCLNMPIILKIMPA